MVIKGPEAPHVGNVLIKHAAWVLGSSGFERLGYYTVTGSLTVFFARELGMDAVFAQQMQAVFQSIVYMMPILGAFVADTWTGRYLISVIAIGCAAIGVGGILAGQLASISWLSLLSLFVFFAAPIAMVKPNLIVLGGDQFNASNEDQLKQRGNFFEAYYWITNIAAALAFLVMNQIAVEGMGSITQDFSFTFVFCLGMIFFVMSFLVLFFGSKKIYAPDPTGSSLVSFFKVTSKAVKKAPTKNGMMVLAGVSGLFASVVASIPSFFFDAPALDYVLSAIIIISCLLLVIFGRSGEWIRHADVTSPGMFDKQTITGACQVYRLTPYIAFAIPFWSVYNQMNTGFIAQGCQMNNNISGMKVAPATMPTWNSVVIIFVIPIFNKLIYPCMNKIGFPMSPLRRIGAGFFVAALSMLAAALMEYARRGSDIFFTECDQQAVILGWCSLGEMGTMVPELSSCYQYVGDFASIHVPKRDYSMMIQIVSFGLVGLAEVLVAITLYDFFYSQVPPYMRSVCQAIQMLTTSLGTMVGAVINNLCKSWLPNNLDNGNQEFMYFINMGFSVVMLALFVVVANGFEYVPGTSGYPGDVIDKEEDDLEDKAHYEYEYYSDE